jgi:hypothetical protein
MTKNKLSQHVKITKINHPIKRSIQELVSKFPPKAGLSILPKDTPQLWESKETQLAKYRFISK